MTCDAYPEGIPEGIATGVISHATPQSGDHGLQFEPVPEEFLVKGEGLIDHVNDLVDREEVAYRRVKTVLKRKGYADGDFEPGGPLYGRSTNELIEMARPPSA